jgi:hypothetical protein
MAQTRFSGPVRSDNGFVGTFLSGTISSSSANITNLVVTSLTIGSTKLTNGSVSGTVAGQLGRIPVLIGSTTRYIALYDSLTP